MTFPPRVRKVSLTLHMFASVGWVGAVVMYLALGIAATTSDDKRLVRASYVTMDWAGWRVLVPFAVASLLTGITHALITPWGLTKMPTEIATRDTNQAPPGSRTGMPTRADSTSVIAAKAATSNQTETNQPWLLSTSGDTIAPAQGRTADSDIH